MYHNSLEEKKLQEILNKPLYGMMSEPTATVTWNIYSEMTHFDPGVNSYIYIYIYIYDEALFGDAE